MVAAWDSYEVARDLQTDHAVEAVPDPQCLAQHVDVRLLAVPGQVLVQRHDRVGSRKVPRNAQ
jgi:hypothetical protein